MSAVNSGSVEADSDPKYTYAPDKVIGNGSFGTVYLVKITETDEMVAIKKVYQDRRYKNRELSIMRELIHPNIVPLKHAFFNKEPETGDVFLNLVMEYMPDNIYRIMKNYYKSKQRIPVVLIKLYSYQLLRALAYLHAKGICHRDIKPQNLLINDQTHVLKLCDFGSAKPLSGESNISYICSRYYRAPELMFSSTVYNFSIDVWSAGCVIAEMLLGQPLFAGETGVDQLVEIMRVLGTPTRGEIRAMNPSYTEYKFPMVKSYPWSRVFRGTVTSDAMDLVKSMLKYNPHDRPTAIELLQFSFFDELRTQECMLPNDVAMPPLFNWTPEEKSVATEHLLSLLTPNWYKPPKS